LIDRRDIVRTSADWRQRVHKCCLGNIVGRACSGGTLQDSVHEHDGSVRLPVMPDLWPRSGFESVR
jgi:hypothetical protein